MTTAKKQLELQDEVIATFAAADKNMSAVESKRIDQESQTSPYSNNDRFEPENDQVKSSLLSKYAIHDTVHHNLTFVTRLCRGGKLRLTVFSNFNEVFVLYGELQVVLNHEGLSDIVDIHQIKITDAFIKYFPAQNAIAIYSKHGIVFSVSGTYNGFTKLDEFAYTPPKDRIYKEL